MPSDRCVPVDIAVDGLADVVDEGGADADVRVEPDLARHHARQERDFLRMIQHVLTVAGAELQFAHQPENLRMQVEQPQLERRQLAFLEHGGFHLGLHLLDDLLDPRRMNAAIGDQLLDGLTRDFAAERIERGQDDRARRVVDDQLDARGQFQRADVATLAADDAALHVVARQIDDRDRRLDGVLRRAALDRFRDDLTRLRRRNLARLVFEPLDADCAASRRASVSICRISRSRASSAVRLAIRCSSRC